MNEFFNMECRVKLLAFCDEDMQKQALNFLAKEYKIPTDNFSVVTSEIWVDPLNTPKAKIYADVGLEINVPLYLEENQQSELEELREVVEIFAKHFSLAECSLGSLGPTFHTLIDNRTAIKLTDKENELLEKYIKKEY